MKRAGIRMAVLAAMALTLVAATSAIAQADDKPAPKGVLPAANDAAKFQLDLSSDAPSSKAPSAPPGLPFRRDPDNGIPFLGLRLSTPIGK